MAIVSAKQSSVLQYGLLVPSMTDTFIVLVMGKKVTVLGKIKHLGKYLCVTGMSTGSERLVVGV